MPIRFRKDPKVVDLAKKVMNGVRVTSEDLLHYRKRRRRYQEDLQAQLYSEKGLNFYFSVSKIIWRGEVRPNGKKSFFSSKARSDFKIL